MYIHRRIIDSFFQAAMGMTSRGLRSQEVTSLRAYVGRKVDGFLDTDKHEGIAIDWISALGMRTIISFKFVYKELWDFFPK